MTQQIINVGAAPNDGQGDPIRNAFIKCNDNFNELFSTYTSVPATLYGQSGDIARMYADNANYFYYCFQDYTDGTDIIWAKISEVDTTSYISNGNTSVAIPTTNGSILFDVGNVSNVMVMTTDGFTLTGNASVSKNITVANDATVGNDINVGRYAAIGSDATVFGNLAVIQKSTFSDNVTVNANLTVNGNITYINVDELKVTDPLIQLAANNATTDVLDIGFYGEWNDGVFQYGGLARDASDGDWKLFSNVTTQPTTTVDFTNAVYDNLVLGDLTSQNIFNSGNVSVTGNVDVTANLNANNATITNNTTIGGYANITGNVNVTANVNANNATITRNVVVVGNTTSGNVISLGNVNVTSNVNANNATITNNVVVGGNTTSGNVSSLGNVDVTGNVNVTANINANNATLTNNLVAGGNVTATGLVTSGLYWANGSPIISNTGNLSLNSITTSGNANIGGNIYGTNAILSGDINANNATITNIVTANVVLSNIANISNATINSAIATNMTVVGNIFTGNIQSYSNVVAPFGNLIGANAVISNGVFVGGNTNVTGNVNANNATITNNVAVGGTMFVGNIIPSANVTYTLGNATNQWKDLWVSNATIYLNSTPLTMSNASVLLWNTVPLISSVTDQNLNSTGNIVAANITGTGFFFANGSPVVTASGNVASNNIVAIGNISSGASTSVGANLLVSGSANVVGNSVAGNISTTGNVNAGNVIATTASLGTLGVAGNIISTAGSSITLDPLNDGSSLGTVFVLGNLQVTGNVTTVNSTTVTTDSLLYQAANNAINATAASGGGLAIGPAGNSYATWTFNSTSNSWVSNLPITATGGANMNGAITNATNITANGNISTSNLTVTGTANLSTANVQIYSLGVGTAASGVLGEIRAANNITGYYSSDSKFKENIVDISEPANKVRAIGGKMFDWTDSYIADRGGLDDYFLRKHDFGVVAQDVQKVLPEAVHERPDGSLAVDYPKLSALAFAAINEITEKFSREIAELRSEIEQLKGK